MYSETFVERKFPSWLKTTKDSYDNILKLKKDLSKKETELKDRMNHGKKEDKEIVFKDM